MSDVKATTPFAVSWSEPSAQRCQGGRRRRKGGRRQEAQSDADDEDEDERKNASVVGEDDGTTSQAAKGGALRNRTTTRRTIRTMSTPRTKTMKQELMMDDDKDQARKAAKAERTRAGKIIAHGIDKGCVEAFCPCVHWHVVCFRHTCWINKLRQICGQRVAPWAIWPHECSATAQSRAGANHGRQMLLRSSSLPENAAGAKRLNRRSTIQSS